ncbi:MAG: hypothetical protein EXX96DRAFT_367570 [Benjaminiella poitrasii]|nr:MAG: hypothetical protein EXX96DRAFT_115939 [Benjaminiella poitrasii]KAI9470738.1 MAG: hypothetical protein EXX96DRAFT_367570 [Benjaminiella poitrasii]
MLFFFYSQRSVLNFFHIHTCPNKHQGFLGRTITIFIYLFLLCMKKMSPTVCIVPMQFITSIVCTSLLLHV